MSESDKNQAGFHKIYPGRAVKMTIIKLPRSI